MSKVTIMLSMTLRPTKAAEGFYRAFVIEGDKEVDDILRSISQTFNIQSVKHDIAFQYYLRKLCKHTSTTIIVGLEGDLIVLSDHEDGLDRFFYLLLTDFDYSFETSIDSGVELWKFRLEAENGDTIYFIGDKDDEVEWIKNNLTLFKRCELNPKKV